MDYVNPQSLVSTDWLAEHINAPDVRVVDASWYMPAENRDPAAEYDAEHIPGAVRFDIDEIADTDSDLPHMMPSPEKFSSRMRKAGIGDGNRVVVYDGGMMMAAARAWWMLRTFGHDDVAILDGGFNKWKAEGRPLEDMPPTPRERHFTARLNSTMIRYADQMLANIDSQKEQVVDARAQARFDGIAPEPRAGLRGGHIPGSVCVPFIDVIDDDKTMLPAADIKEAFTSAGLDLKKPIVATCGSGVSAAMLVFAMHLIGQRQNAVYDGSWTEWGGREDLPIEA
ncbi:MAG: 3-mercaptopyruvate sulfurtransferase [Alphaproteobacteria bacterium]|jgi:thiosulfate/3-mercaptopyruvate sulfurtransferase|nr:3-mercaptopyruvate sulfurtransferase [Alphaproteobacteria bacterium]MBT4085250.1 3-mercaptopyruvate sulfurtransferase [Alphaproteobacteria bacterium]MBT4544966.1 3-mercaptopyruvate sulfurtransferase [Alphaproteobacteria bacterium]MBT7746183.1 3-mercaptopyruvate sulfurtransferase [Alphaproteobacteria bacterium]